MTMLAIVNADKEGQIEGKMMKSRQMEEIREARRKEADARQDQRMSKLVSCPESCFLFFNYLFSGRRIRKNRCGEKGSEDLTEVTQTPQSYQTLQVVPEQARNGYHSHEYRFAKSSRIIECPIIMVLGDPT